MINLLELYQTMYLIRKFEEKLLNLFSTGKILGTTHAYIGQEANAAGIFSVLDGSEIIFSNHRCHGHYLAYGGDPYLLAAEVMGKATGLVGGRGGSQHIQYRNFYSNGIQGGIAPIATGMALAEKILNNKIIALVFLGDGTLGQGIVYESLNIASLWKIPILFVVENNLYAQTTPIKYAMAGDIQSRFRAFGINATELTTTDVAAIRESSEKVVTRIKKNGDPEGLIFNTYRFSAHSKGDDFRDPKEIEIHKKKDPLLICRSKLDCENLAEIEEKIMRKVDESFKRASKDMESDPQKLAEIII